MSIIVIEADEPSKLAEQSMRALWVLDSPVFESCRCACCGGLRRVERELIAPQAEPDRPGS